MHLVKNCPKLILKNSVLEIQHTYHQYSSSTPEFLLETRTEQFERTPDSPGGSSCQDAVGWACIRTSCLPLRTPFVLNTALPYLFMWCFWRFKYAKRLQLAIT